MRTRRKEKLRFVEELRLHVVENLTTGQWQVIRLRRQNHQAKRSGLKKRIEENMNGKGKEAYIKAVAKATGYPLPILREVHERGARAYATGRRPGASQAAWSRARVLSFVQGGKTSKTADKELYKKAKEQMRKRKK
jgi:hypothetical protein